MAWQLIYTSAEHGLAAGRSGFCTVARHAAIRERLVVELERLSVFDRPSAAQPLPVIRAHRILTVGSDCYHILSCTQDAGPDYSGRTNHIAHHLICEEHELARTASPALVLRQFPWRKRWNEQARHFDDSERVDLSQFRNPAAAVSLWKELTGNPAHERLLIEPSARAGCFVAYTQGDDDRLLLLFSESLGRLDRGGDTPQALWQITFTTFLQATDHPRDFAWRGCWAGNTVHREAQSGNEKVFDLTQPASLPMPAPVEVPRAVTVTALPTPPRVQVVMPPGKSRGKSIWSKLRGRYDGLPEEQMEQQLAEELPPHLKRKLKWRKKRPKIIMALLGLVVVAAVGCWYCFWRKPRSDKNPSAGVNRPLRTQAEDQTPALVDNQPLTTTTSQTPPQASDLDQLTTTPTYVLLLDSNNFVDVGSILRKHGGVSTNTSTSFSVETDAFPLSPNIGTGKEGEWRSSGDFYRLYCDKTTLLLTIDGRKQLSREGTNHLTLRCSGASAYFLVLLDQAQLKQHGSPFTPLTFGRQWLCQTSGDSSVTVSNALTERLQKVLFLSGTNAAPLQLTSSTAPSHSLKIDLAGPRQKAQDDIKRFDLLLQKLRGERDADAKTNAFQLTSLLQKEVGNSLSNWLVDVETKHNPDRKYNPPTTFASKKESAHEVWSDYIAFLQRELQRVEDQLLLPPRDAKRKLKDPKNEFRALITAAEKEPRKLPAVFEDLLKKKDLELGEKNGELNSWKEIFAGQISHICQCLRPWPRTNEIAQAENQRNQAHDGLARLPETLADLRQVRLEMLVDANRGWPLIEFKD